MINHDTSRHFIRTDTQAIQESFVEIMESRQFVGPKFSREHIDNMRRRYESLPNKTPADHEVLLEFLERPAGSKRLQVALMTIKSGAKNALSGKMISQLTDRLDELEIWLSKWSGADDTSARCLMVRGHGGTFCSGSDLVSVRGTLDQLAGLELAQVMQYNLVRLQELPIVSCAFIEGYALGGGAELATGLDFRLMTADARIGFVHSRVGVCCGWGGGTRLVQLVGRSRGLELLSSGRLLDANEAQRINLITGQCATLDEAMEFLANHSIRSMRTSRAIKSLVNAAECLPMSSSLQVEAHLFAATWGQMAHLEALDANIKHKAPENGGSSQS